MIEIVYEKEKQKPEGNEEFFRIPNNIRQIGEVGGTQKIYIEDYAYTYLCRIASENSGRGISAILLGQSNWRDGTSYLFIKSAIVLTDMEINEEHLVFTQEIWNHVYEKNKEYFQEQEIVGWFLSIPGCSMEINQIICQTHLNHFGQEIWNHVYEKNKEYFQEQEIVGWFLSIPGCSMEINQIICQTHLNHFGGNDKILFVMEPLEKEEAFYRYEDGKMIRQCSMEINQIICQTHLNHFGGNDKILFVMEPLEKEEAFYRYEDGKMIRQTGFYVYYEKNEAMRNYLVSQNEKSEKKSEEVDDAAVHTFRKKIEKKTGQEQKKAGFPLFKTASVCAVYVRRLRFLRLGYCT